MATNKRLRDCSPTEPAEQSATTKRLHANPPGDETAAEALPLDLLIEILARSDVATIVRSAAVSRTLRGAVLDEGFRRRLALRAAANGGYDPGLLRGVSYRLEECDVRRFKRVVQALPLSSDDDGARKNLIRFDASLSFTPVASRDGLVLLRRAVYGRYVDEFSVCDSVTGHTTVLPPVAIGSYYPRVLLAVGDVDGGRSSFEVLAADKNLRTQTYSSREGKWSAVVPPAAQLPLHDHPSSCDPVETSHPVVIGRTVHWLCSYFPDASRRVNVHILALDVDAAQATVIELPPRCLDRMTGVRSLRSLMLVVSSDGELGLVVSETSAIAMWTMSSSSSASAAARWSRRVVKPMPNWGEYGSIETRGFGERSGTVMLYMEDLGLVHLNVATGESVVVARSIRRSNYSYTIQVTQVCLHEVNLAALLRSMKPFI